LVLTWLVALTGGVAWVVVDPSNWASLSFLFPATVGGVLVTRRPDHPIGWFLSAFGWILGLSGLLVLYSRIGGFASEAAYVVAGFAWVPLVGLITPILSLFPNGKPLTPNWRWVAWTAVPFALLAVVGNGFEGTLPDGFRRAAVDGAGFFVVVGLLSAVVSLALRYRRGSGVERQQLKWVIAAASTIPAGVFVGEMGNQALQPFVLPISLSLLSSAMAVAILRYRLYEIDRIISRTVSYGVVAALLVATYAGSVFLIQAILPASGDLATAASTLAAAALFNPFRRRTHRWVNRRFNRERFDAEREVEAFSGRLRTEVGLGAVTSELTGVVTRTVQPAMVTIWVKEPR
jgi:hypothetical protein